MIFFFLLHIFSDPLSYSVLFTLLFYFSQNFAIFYFSIFTCVYVHSWIFCLSFILEFWTLNLDLFILIEIYFTEECLRLNPRVLFVFCTTFVCLFVYCVSPSVYVFVCEWICGGQASTCMWLYFPSTNQLWEMKLGISGLDASSIPTGQAIWLVLVSIVKGIFNMYKILGWKWSFTVILKIFPVPSLFLLNHSDI